MAAIPTYDMTIFLLKKVAANTAEKNENLFIPSGVNMHIVHAIISPLFLLRNTEA